MRTILIAVTAITLGTALGMAMTQYRMRKAEMVLGGDSLAPPLAPIDAPQPEVAIEGEVFDFGKMPRGDKGSHSFEIRNTGNGDLLLKQGETTCKCTISELSDGRIPPGESAKVTLQWKAVSRGRQFRQRAQIWTNDRQRRRVELYVEGELTQPIVADPPEVIFGAVSNDAAAQRTANVLVYKDAPVDPPRAEVIGGQGTVQMDIGLDKIDPEQLKGTGAVAGYRIVVRVPQGSAAQSFDRTVRVHGFSDRRSLDIPVQGRVVRPLAVSGPNWERVERIWDLGRVHSGSTEQTLYISARGPHRAEVQLLVKSADPGGMVVRLGAPQELNEGAVRRFALHVSFPRGFSVANMDKARGVIQIAATHPVMDQIDIPVKFEWTENIE